MKLEYGIIIVVGIFASISLGLISFQPDIVPHWEALHDIKQQSDIGCDEECTLNQRDGFLCAETTKNEHVCRPPREIFYPERATQMRTAFPPEYGEFLYFPDGLTTDDGLLFDIDKVDLINPDTKQIRIEFANHNIRPPEPQFEYITELVPGQTFVSHCTGSERKTAHMVEYLDVFELDGTTYIEFWGSHVTMPDSLLPCQLPELIKNSIQYDLSLGINFEKLIAGSYELENPLCMGGRGIIVNENCERIGKYDPATGMPIVENKEQCDMLKGDWNEEQKTCDSKYGVK